MYGERRAGNKKRGRKRKSFPLVSYKFGADLHSLTAPIFCVRHRVKELRAITSFHRLALLLGAALLIVVSLVKL